MSTGISPGLPPPGSMHYSDMSPFMGYNMQPFMSPMPYMSPMVGLYPGAPPSHGMSPFPPDMYGDFPAGFMPGQPAPYLP